MFIESHVCLPPVQGIFKSGDPAKRARAIVEAVTHYNGMGQAMPAG